MIFQFLVQNIHYLTTITFYILTQCSNVVVLRCNTYNINNLAANYNHELIKNVQLDYGINQLRHFDLPFFGLGNQLREVRVLEVPTEQDFDQLSARKIDP